MTRRLLRLFIGVVGLALMHLVVGPLVETAIPACLDQDQACFARTRSGLAIGLVLWKGLAVFLIGEAIYRLLKRDVDVL